MIAATRIINAKGDVIMKNFMFLCIFASLLLSPAMAFADRFSDCDRHNTGYLTYKEAKRCFDMDKRTFNEIDRNGNGKISRREMREYQDAQKKKHRKGWRDWF